MSNKLISFLAGGLVALAFAPVYLFVGIFGLSIFLRQTQQANSLKNAVYIGWFFGFGFFLTSLYWVSFSIFVYIEDFWWFFPIALIGLPAFLAFFCSALSGCVFPFKNSHFYQTIFCLLWILMEWTTSWAFTGFPWSLLGYVFTFSDIMSQSASIFGVIGLSFIAVYVGTSTYNINNAKIPMIVSLLILCSMYGYGWQRLQSPREDTDITVKIVQPCIDQSSKWDFQTFHSNFNRQIQLSNSKPHADLIIWSEAALILPHNHHLIAPKLRAMLNDSDAILISGSTEELGFWQDEDYKLYTSMVAVDSSLSEIFVHRKTHLVPFSEYMPLKKYLPFKKLTYGFVDYFPGKREKLQISSLQLKIYPLICYESIFFNEIITDIDQSDVIINITNDAWFGRSSGPYQHFAINKIRAIELGLPLVRAANNGISAIIDPMGRVVSHLQLNQLGVIDGFIPKKLQKKTSFSCNSWKNIFILLLMVVALQEMLIIARKKMA